MRIAYGDDPSQFLDLQVPAGDGPFPAVVLLHGGFWQAQYGLDLMVGLADDAHARGYVAVNVEYRRVGNGGGWPTTFDDVAAAVDHLATLDVPIDLDRVVVVGHSAGGHLAAWVGSRTAIPAGQPGADPQVVPCAVVGQAAVVDLTGADRTDVGDGATAALMGGHRDQVPERYAVADPLLLAPPPGPVLLVHAQADPLVPFSQSRAYADRVEGAELVSVPGGHFTVIDPRDGSWELTMHWIARHCS